MTSPRSDVEREGTPLVEQAARLCRAGDRPGLSALAEAWLEWLAASDEGRGALDARDVVVDDRGELKWIGRAAPEGESGDNPWRHPASRPEAPSLRADTFAGLVGLLELRALAADPSLCRSGPDHPLVLASEDLRDPIRSPVFKRLIESSDPEVRRLTEVCSHLYEFPLDDLPALGELVRLPRRRRSPAELLADLRALVREAADLSAAERAALAKHLSAEPIPPERVGLGPASTLIAVEPIEVGKLYMARWAWPDPALSGRCVVALCPTPPSPGDTPETARARRRWTVRVTDSAPFRIQADPSWRGDTVAVWAALDLGEGWTIHTAPLVLGRLEGGRGLFGWLKGP